MPLNENQLQFVEFAFPVIKENRHQLSTWEQGFMDDQFERFTEYGPDTSFSEKQWAVIERVWNKLDFVVPPGVTSRA
jgi:hypothetical protein